MTVTTAIGITTNASKELVNFLNVCWGGWILSATSAVAVLGAVQFGQIIVIHRQKRMYYSDKNNTKKKKAWILA